MKRETLAEYPLFGFSQDAVRDCLFDGLMLERASVHSRSLRTKIKELTKSLGNLSKNRNHKIECLLFFLVVIPYVKEHLFIPYEFFNTVKPDRRPIRISISIL